LVLLFGAPASFLTIRYDGQLFRGRYKSILIETDSNTLELVRYIHRNPLKEGVVETIQKYE
jgi:putative transposase